MRLRRLDLIRYGKFTDHSIDFGPTRPGSADLHIVYGLNEAGKSTTFSAYLDLLYGIGERSSYNFLHPYNTMKVGACIEIDGAEHELARIKLRTGSLIDNHDRPVAEALLTGALGGIGRDAYRTMFSLDDQSLKEGGNAILQSKGELGELLFSASSGLAGLSRSLIAAADEANAIYKKRSPSTRLAELRRALDVLKTERSAIDTLASAYSTLKATHDQAETTYNATSRELADAKIRLLELNRLLSVLPPAQELSRLKATRVEMGDMPRPPVEWFALLPQLSRDETRLAALLDSAERTARQLNAEIEAIVLDDRALRLASHIPKLDLAQVRYRAADGDLPKRRLALAEQEGALGRLLADLEQPGHPTPEALLLPASLVGIIRDLIERRSGIEAKIAAACREEIRAKENVDQLNEENGRSNLAPLADPAQLGRIEAAFHLLSNSDVTSRLAVEERALVSTRRVYERLLAHLAPWSGDTAALRQTTTADARLIEAWRSQAVAIDKRIAEHEAKLRDLGTELASIKAQIKTSTARGSFDDAEAARLRMERDASWQAHLADLNETTARTFEGRMRQDDLLSAERLARAQELAELRQLRGTEATLCAAIERQEQLLGATRVEHDALAARIRALLPEALASESDAMASIAILESWSTRRAAALGAWNDLLDAENAVAALRAEQDQHTTALAAELDEAQDMKPSDLLRHASNFISAAKAAQTARLSSENALSNAVRDLRERERDRKEAEIAVAAWEREWTEALSKTWFADKTGSMAAVREILTALAALPAILKERNDLAGRVAAMERDQDELREDVSRLFAESGWDQPALDDLACADALVERYELARHGSRLRAEKRGDLDTHLRKMRALEEELEVHTARRNELAGFFGTESLADLEMHLDRAKERDRLEERIASLRAHITDTLRVTDMAEAERRIDGIDAEALERDAAELASRIEDLTERAKLLYSDMSLARQKLEAVGGDDAVARMEVKRRTIFLEIEELAIQHLTLRAGTLAAEQALHLYREKHRSSMLNRASEAFRLITRGNYSGLTSQPDRDRETLIGVSRDGSSKLADAMSTGTQFQLYLALRLAGYEEFAAVRPAVPFIADDIMESFDNPRSEEVFRLLGEMAKVGQVIYLTHHWHLCEIAQRIVQEATIHQLP